MPELMGISHIDLTVSDCGRAAAWWQDVVGFTLVHRTGGETFETRSLVHPSGVAVTVMTHDGTPETGAFDERRVGLDHLAFRVADLDELRRWVTHLDVKGVTHSGIIDIGYGPTVVFRDPDNMQLEFYVHQSVDEMQLDAPDSEEARRIVQQAHR
jgi:glyoxylase I family protein